MGKIILYHGSPNKVVVPQFGFGEGKHDYGKGFYLTDNIELAKEWAVNKDKDGYANIYELDISDLKILNLNSEEFLVDTSLGKVLIEGVNLEMQKLELEKGELVIVGKIDSIIYQDKSKTDKIPVLTGIYP